MQELIDKLKAEAGLTDEQAKQAIATIKNFVIEKFQMLEGAVNNVFGSCYSELFYAFESSEMAISCLVGTERTAACFQRYNNKDKEYNSCFHS